MSLVKPGPLTGDRMFGHCLANLRSAKVLVSMPLNLHSGFRAIILNFGLAVSLENFAPGEIERIVIVPDVHHLLANEFLPDCRIDLLENFAAVGDRCFASLRGRLKTKEPDDRG